MVGSAAQKLAGALKSQLAFSNWNPSLTMSSLGGIIWPGHDASQDLTY